MESGRLRALFSAPLYYLTSCPHDCYIKLLECMPGRDLASGRPNTKNVIRQMQILYKRSLCGSPDVPLKIFKIRWLTACLCSVAMRVHGISQWNMSRSG